MIQQKMRGRPASREQGFVVWVAIGLMVVIGVMLAGGYYLWKKTQGEMGQLHDYVAKVESDLAVKNKAVMAFQTSLAKVAADAQSQDAILADHLRTLDDHLNALDSQVKAIDKSNDEWLLSEVEYLLKMADLRIGMKQDVKGAVAIMKNAEELVRKVQGNDEGLVNVRVAITRDIAGLELYREIDVPGTYAQLVSMGDTIEKLPLVPTKLTEEQPSTDGKPSKLPAVLADVNEAFAGYITIRRHDTAELKALLSPEQRLNFRDSVRLTLDQAQTALLRSDQATYDASIAKLRQWVLDYFAQDNFKVQIASKKIDELAKVQVKQDLPSIAESQQELRRYISDKMAGY